MDNLQTNIAPAPFAPVAPAPTPDPVEASFDIADRQDALEQRQDRTEERVDGLRTDVDEVKARLDRVGRTAQRPALGTDGTATAEVKGFVDGYLRRGREHEIKSITSQPPSDGGYAVPRQIDALIARELTRISPIRAIAQVVQTGSAGYRKLITTGGVASGWVGETDPRPETGTPDFAEIAPPTGELYANPAASQTMLDDAAFRPRGVAGGRDRDGNSPAPRVRPSSPATDRTGRAASSTIRWPRISTATGPSARCNISAAAMRTGLGGAPQERLIDLIHALKAGHRQGASFVMNAATLAQVRKLKTADGNFLWQPGLVEGQPDRLLGYPVVEAEDMPDVAAGAAPIAFGNFRHGYLIAERSATHILRDPFTNKPFVHFYATKRVGGAGARLERDQAAADRGVGESFSLARSGLCPFAPRGRPDGRRAVALWLPRLGDRPLDGCHPPQPRLSL